MAAITIRGLDDSVKDSLRRRAAENGHSMEEEARQILKQGVAGNELTGAEWLDRFQTHVKRFGGVDLKIPKRTAMRRPPTFE